MRDHSTSASVPQLSGPSYINLKQEFHKIIKGHKSKNKSSLRCFTPKMFEVSKNLAYEKDIMKRYQEEVSKINKLVEKKNAMKNRG